jgi:hypothetical protein
VRLDEWPVARLAVEHRLGRRTEIQQLQPLEGDLATLLPPRAAGRAPAKCVLGRGKHRRRVVDPALQLTAGGLLAEQPRPAQAIPPGMERQRACEGVLALPVLSRQLEHVAQGLEHGR